MTRGSWIGWISAAVALVAIAIVVIDIIQTQAGKGAGGAPVTRTVEAARSAGAFVAPTDPKQTPVVKGR
jgi:hypothetical protein